MCCGDLEGSPHPRAQRGRPLLSTDCEPHTLCSAPWHSPSPKPPCKTGIIMPDAYSTGRETEAQPDHLPRATKPHNQTGFYPSHQF